jgi:hypothetical protein
MSTIIGMLRSMLQCCNDVVQFHIRSKHMTSTALLQAQVDIVERVAGLEEQMCRLEVTHGTRICDTASTMFTSAGPASRETHLNLVNAATSAALSYTSNECRLTSEEADALVEETLVALMNDLMMSRSSEKFFGVDVPSVVKLDLNESPEQWHIQAPGLLLYRLWQLLVRTPHGRWVLLHDTPDKQSRLSSFSTVRNYVSGCLQKNNVKEMLKRCVDTLETSDDVTKKHSRLTSLEKQSIVLALDSNVLNFAKVC